MGPQPSSGSASAQTAAARTVAAPSGAAVVPVTSPTAPVAPPTTALPTATAPAAPSTTAPAPPPTAPQAPPLAGGFSEGASLNWETGAELAAHLDGMRAIGATWLRFDIDWSGVEPSKGTYDWSVPDRIVDGARARGMSVLAMVGYSPAWARAAGTDDKYGPTNPADFANFAAAAAARYRGRVSAYEIWNEPNRGFWHPRPDPVGYTTLLIGAYNAIKGADPAATVLTGGFSPSPDAADGSAIAPVTFLNAMYAAGAGGHFDGLAHHPYNYPFSPLRPENVYNYNAFAGVTPALRQSMVDHGDSAKKIWATEIGAPTPATVNGVATSPQYLATYIAEATAQWQQWSWTGPMFWYSYRDAGTNPNDLEQLFGLVSRSWVPKEPAYSAMRDALT